MPAKGQKHSDEAKRKMSAVQKDKPRSKAQKQHLHRIQKVNKGKPHIPMSKKIKQKISSAKKGKKLTDEHKRKLSKVRKGKPAHNKGKKVTDEARKHMSAAQMGIPYNTWESYPRDKKYCPKFNNACRESNREKYGRRCFICNKTEKTNRQKLSVHHVDMDKAQGCESNWMLVPLCKSCHSKAHNEELITRLGYLIKGVI